MADTSTENTNALPLTITRGVLASSEVLFGQSQDIKLYVESSSGKMQAKPITQYGKIPLIFYEVSTPTTGSGAGTGAGTGSWWLPTCTVPDTPSGAELWGTWGPLEVDEKSTIVSQSVLRPQNAWCWVPLGVIEENLSPLDFLGRVLGKHPSQAPS